MAGRAGVESWARWLFVASAFLVFMANIQRGDPLLMKLAPRVFIDRVLEDPEQPEHARYYPFTCHRLEDYEEVAALSLWQDLCRRFVDGPEHELLPPIDGRYIMVSSNACRLVAYLFTAQRQDQPRWTCEQLLMMMTSSTIFAQMDALAVDIRPAQKAKEAEDDGKGKVVHVDPLASGASPSSGPASETSSPTPN